MISSGGPTHGGRRLGRVEGEREPADLLESREEPSMAERPMKARGAAVDWSADVHRALKAEGVTQVAYVPDGGMKRLIELANADPGMRAVPLTSEEEGPCLMAGAWLGGAKGCVIMQSSGVGNCVNNFTLSEVCQFPLLILVSQRATWGEGNRWQVPTGQRCAPLLELSGFRVHQVERPEDAGETVRAATQHAYFCLSSVAVLFSQRVFGAKRFLR
jgi:sulfopyruvate decarboxylase alpha subunit